MEQFLEDSKRNATFGTIAYIGNSRQEKYLKEILHIKLCNMNSGYIHKTLFNWALKMLIASIGGRREEGEQEGRVRNFGSKTISINSSFWITAWDLIQLKIDQKALLSCTTTQLLQQKGILSWKDASQHKSLTSHIKINVNALCF